MGGDGGADELEGLALQGGGDSELVDAYTTGEDDGVAGEGGQVVEKCGQVVDGPTVGAPVAGVLGPGRL